MIRKIIENAFFLYVRLPAQQMIWDQLQDIVMDNISLVESTQHTIQILQRLRLNPDTFPKIDSQIKKICLEGLDPQLRPALWFTLLDGMNNYNLLKDILKRRFFIFSE